MIRRSSDFIKAFSEVADKFTWYFSTEVRQGIQFKAIRGIKGDNERNIFSPITAYVEAMTGKFFDITRFDKAGEELWIAAECVIQVVDAADDWPDRLHGYNPKGYEQSIRKQLLQICSL